MARGCLTLLVGFSAGIVLMLALWPHTPSGTRASSASDLRVFISDSYLARRLQDRISGMSVPSVKNVRINSNAPHSLVVHMSLSAGPVSAPASVEVAPVAQAGQIHLDIVTSDVAGIPIPSQLFFILSDAINARAANILAKAGTVTSVSILPSGIEVSANAD